MTQLTKLSSDLILDVVNTLKSQNQAVTVRSVFRYLADHYQIKPSFSTISNYLNQLESQDSATSRVSPDKAVRPLGAVLDFHSRSLASGADEESSAVSDLNQLRIELAKAKALIEVRESERDHFKAMAARLSSELSALQEDFSSKFSGMARDFMELMQASQDEFSAEISKIRLERNAAHEQWKGMRTFLYEQVDKIRMQESGQVAILKKKLDDLEVRLATSDGLLNAIREKYYVLKGKYEPTPNSIDLDQEP